MANQEAYQVKVLVKHSNPLVKMKPPFLEGIVIESSAAQAEAHAIAKLIETHGSSEISFEKFKVKKLKSHFIYG